VVSCMGACVLYKMHFPCRRARSQVPLHFPNCWSHCRSEADKASNKAFWRERNSLASWMYSAEGIPFVSGAAGLEACTSSQRFWSSAASAADSDGSLFPMPGSAETRSGMDQWAQRQARVVGGEGCAALGAPV